MDCETTTEPNRPTQTLAGILKFKTRYHSKFLTRFWERHRRRQQQTQHQQRQQHKNASQGTSYARLNTSRNSIISVENQNYGKSVLPRDSIQMQCLDVGSLLKMNERRDYKRLQCESLTEGTLSFAGSSLDLEWEHEYDDQQQQQQDDADADEARHSWFQSDDDSSSSSSEANGRSIELSQFSTPSQKLNKQNNNLCPSKTTATVTTQWHSRHRSSRGHSQNRNESANRSTSLTKLEDGDNKSKRNTNWSHTSTPDSLEWDTHEDERKFKSEEDSLDQETVDLLNEIEWLKTRALIETGDTQWSSKQANS